MKKILIGVVAVLVVLVALIASRPESFHVERSVDIAAPAEVAYAYLLDFHNFGAWSPWDKLDPAMKRTYEGPGNGVGASYAWAGNDKVGEGKMTVVGVRPNELIQIKLDFLKPFESHNQTTFAMKSKGELVTVTWAMDGHNDLMGKAMSLVMNMDKMVGGDFEKGLGALKPIVEAEAKKAAEAKLAAEKAAAEKAAAEAAAAAGEGQPSAAPN